MAQIKDDVIALRRQGFRLTPQRLLIFEVIKGSVEHLSADAIYAEVVAHYPRINVATVYRNLQWLHDMGMIRKIDVGCGRLLWEYAGTAPHHHLICERCEMVQEIDNHVVECLGDHVQHHYRFAVNLNHLAIFGLCAACQTATGAGEPGA